MRVKAVLIMGKARRRVLMMDKACNLAESIFQHQYQKQVKSISLYFYFMIGFIWSLYLRKYFFDVVRNKLQTVKYLY